MEREAAGDGASPQNEVREHVPLVKELWETHVWRLFPLLTLYIVCLTLLMPLNPTLMTDFFASRHSDHYVHSEYYEPRMEPKICRDAHSSVVSYSSWSDFVSSSFLLFLLAPLVGKWSDVYGRKPFLALTFVCASCTILVLFLNLNYGVSMFFYFPAQAVNGALSSVSICMAYVADKLHPENRAPTFGLIICSFSVGILVGPLGGGYIPPTVASVLSLSGLLVCVLYVILFIPESVTPEAALAAREKQNAMPVHLRGPFQGFAILGRSKLFIKLTICIMISGIVSEGMYELIMQYFQIKLNFGTRDQSHMFVLSGICGMFTQLVILRVLLKYAGKSGMLLIGLAASTMQQTLMIFVWSKPIALFAMCIGSIGNLSFPAVSSIKSVNIAESEQGAMQGALAGARALASGVGPLIFAGLFALFTQSWSPFPYFPGAPFVFGAVMLGSMFVLAATIDRDQAEQGLKHQPGGDDTLQEPLLQGQDAEDAKEGFGLPVNYMKEHDHSAAILLDICPELVCDDALRYGGKTVESQSTSSPESDTPSEQSDLEKGLLLPSSSSGGQSAQVSGDSAQSWHGLPVHPK